MIIPLLDTLIERFKNIYEIGFCLGNITSSCTALEIESFLKNNHRILSDVIEAIIEDWDQIKKKDEAIYYLGFIRNLTTSSEESCTV